MISRTPIIGGLATQGCEGVLPLRVDILEAVNNPIRLGDPHPGVFFFTHVHRDRLPPNPHPTPP